MQGVKTRTGRNLTESPACESEEHGEAEEEQEQEQELEQRGTAPHYPITISDMSAPSPPNLESM